MINNTELTYQEDTIVVTTINNSFLHLDVSHSIAKELSDYFSFMAPNYRFMPAYKNGLFDGRIRLYKIIGSTLPYGLFNRLEEFALERNYTLIDSRVPISYKVPSESHIDSFLKRLCIHSNGNPIEYYDHQLSAIKTCLRKKRTCILSPTSSGKSNIIYSITRYYQNILEGKILIIVPTVNLVNQMYSDFKDYSSEIEYSVEDNVHKISAGKDKNADKQVYISTWQSLSRKDFIEKYPDYFTQFEAVICDEVHLAVAKSITTIMDSCVNAFIRIGLTGTLKNTKMHQMAINGLFGEIIRVASTRELIDKGLISKIDIKFLVLKYNQDICKEINKKVVEKITPQGKKVYRDNYRNEIDYIVSCSERYHFIKNLVNVLDGNILILFNMIEKHGKPLYELIKSSIQDRDVYYLSGETKAEERENIRNSMEEADNSILIASYGTLSTGVNIKSLEYVIFASPYKSEYKVLQSIGRVLRLKEGKKRAVLFDIVDDMRRGRKKNYLYKHFLQRFDIYKEERFPIDIKEYRLL